MVVSTSSMPIFLWMLCMVSLACFMALTVSMLMFAFSTAFICVSSVAMCACVVSRFFSNTFLRFSAALAAVARKGTKG